MRWTDSCTRVEGFVKLVQLSFVDIDALVLVRFRKHSQNQNGGADELTLRAEEKGKALAFDNIKEINWCQVGPATGW